MSWFKFVKKSNGMVPLLQGEELYEITANRDPTPNDYPKQAKLWKNHSTGKRFKLIKYYAVWEEYERVD